MDFIDETIAENIDLIPPEYKVEKPKFSDPYNDEDIRYDEYRNKCQDLLFENLECLIKEASERVGYYHNDKLKVVEHCITHLITLRKTLNNDSKTLKS